MSPLVDVPPRNRRCNGKPGWWWQRGQDPAPLYRLPELTAVPEPPRLPGEREKAADAAARLFPACAAFPISVRGSFVARLLRSALSIVCHNFLKVLIAPWRLVSSGDGVQTFRCRAEMRAGEAVAFARHRLLAASAAALRNRYAARCFHVGSLLCC